MRTLSAVLSGFFYSHCTQCITFFSAANKSLGDEDQSGQVRSPFGGKYLLGQKFYACRRGKKETTQKINRTGE